MKYNLDFTEIIERVDKAKINRDKVRKERAKGVRNDSLFLDPDKIDMSNYSFLTATLVEKIIERKCQYYDFLDFMIDHPSCVGMTVHDIKTLSYNIVNGLRSGQNMSENRIELILEFLKLEIRLVDIETDKEDR